MNILTKFWRYLCNTFASDDLEARQDYSELWKSFDNSNYHQIDSILLIVCDAFNIKRSYRFRLRPTDKLIEIYQNRRYKPVDDLSFSTLSYLLRESTGIEISDFMTDDTNLGDLVKKCVDRDRDWKS